MPWQMAAVAVAAVVAVVAAAAVVAVVAADDNNDATPQAAALLQEIVTESGRTFCRACAALLRLNDRSDQAGCHHDNPEALRVCKDWKLHSWIYGKKGKKKKTGGWGGMQGVCSLKMVQYGAVDYA